LTHIEPNKLASFKSIDDIVIVAYLRPDQEALRALFSSIASKHHGSFVFGYVDDMRTADAEGRAMPSIVAYKSDGDSKILNGHFDDESVEKLLEMSKVNIIGEFSERAQEAYMAVSSYQRTNLYTVNER
jgi:protein disulfide-isomerase A1